MCCKESLALHPSLLMNPLSEVCQLSLVLSCACFKPTAALGSPGGAALFAHAVVLGSCVPVAHHPARPPLFPAVHHPLCLRARVTLKDGNMKPQFRGTS